MSQALRPFADDGIADQRLMTLGESGNVANAHGRAVNGTLANVLTVEIGTDDEC